MRVLVCGGRNLDIGVVFAWLDRCAEAELGGDITCVVHGGAMGADAGAARWAELRQIKTIAYPANWRKYGKRAGPIRNQRMLDEQKPDAVIAFEGGRGTADMVQRATGACRIIKVGWQ